MVRRINVGIDVAKQHFDVSLDTSMRRLGNDTAGHDEVIAMCRQADVDLVVLEASGGYERALVLALQEAGFSVVRINPRQARDFAKSMGVLAKTDQVDARVLRDFANVLAVHPDRAAYITAPQEPQRAELAALGARAAQRPVLVVMMGTAVTVDALTADGQFLGGIILPGHGIMLRALESGTAGLHVPTVAVVTGAFLALGLAVVLVRWRRARPGFISVTDHATYETLHTASLAARHLADGLTDDVLVIAVGPFATDMYLASFTDIATSLGTGKVAVTTTGSVTGTKGDAPRCWHRPARGVDGAPVDSMARRRGTTRSPQCSLGMACRHASRAERAAAKTRSSVCS